MSIKRYTNGVWTDIGDLRRYSSGAWTGCESAKKYSNGAWEEIWPEHLMMKFGWVYTTGSTNPTYEYEPTGRSTWFKLNSTNTARAELVLTCKYEANAGEYITIQLRITDASMGTSQTSFVINFSNEDGLWQTMGTVSIHNEQTQTVNYQVPEGGITQINVVFQHYGSISSSELTLSEVFINGEDVWFSNILGDTEDVDVESKNYRFARVTTTGETTPNYTYSARGTYADVQLTNRSAGYRSEMVLWAPFTASANDSIVIKYTLSNVQLVGLSTANAALVVNFSNRNGLWQTMATNQGIRTGAKTYTLTVPSGGITSVNLVVQVYGNYGVRASFRVASASIDGITYGFI